MHYTTRLIFLAALCGLTAHAQIIKSNVFTREDLTSADNKAVARELLGLFEWTTNRWPSWSGDHSSAASLYQDEFNSDAGLRLTHGAYDFMISAGSTGDVKLLSASDGEPLLISSPTAGTLPNWTTLTNDVVGQASTWRSRLALSAAATNTAGWLTTGDPDIAVQALGVHRIVATVDALASVDASITTNVSVLGGGSVGDGSADDWHWQSTMPTWCAKTNLFDVIAATPSGYWVRSRSTDARQWILIPVGDAGCEPWQNPATATNGWTQYTTRVPYLITASRCRNIRFLWTNAGRQSTGADGVSSGTEAVSFRAAIETSTSTARPVLFNGSTNMSLGLGDSVMSDPVAGSWSQGDVVVLRVYQDVGSATYVHARAGVLSGVIYGSGHGQVNGDSLLSGTIAQSAQTAAFLPTAVYGESPDRAILAIGDSIMAGSSGRTLYWHDSSPTNWSSGWITMACHQLGIPLVNVANGGAKASQHDTNDELRWKLEACRGISAIVSGLGSNDIYGDFNSYDTVTNSLTSLWRRLSATGARVYQTCITKRTSDTAGTYFSVHTNQIALSSAANTVCDQVNAWIATTPWPLSGYVDLTSVVQTNGLWIVDDDVVSGGTADDGTTGYTVVDAAVTFSQEFCGYSVYKGTGGATDGVWQIFRYNSAAPSVSGYVSAGSPSILTTGDTYTICRPCSSEGVHPSAWGYRKMANAAMPWLMSIR